LGSGGSADIRSLLPKQNKKKYSPQQTAQRIFVTQEKRARFGGFFSEKLVAKRL
jgi:hypothetical protein